MEIFEGMGEKYIHVRCTINARDEIINVNLNFIVLNSVLLIPLHIFLVFQQGSQ